MASAAPAEKAQFLITRSLFLKGLGLIYLLAFISLWVQVDGLIGSRGILPVQDLLQAGKQQLGPERYWLAPTLCWFNSSDWFLHFLCGGGVFLSMLLIIGAVPPVVLLLLWVFYLSLVTVGREFMSFQWDILLLETGLLAVFLSPWVLKPRWVPRPQVPSVVLWLFRWLLFRLLFSSGVVKLISGDPSWRGLTALTFHYETQPLPSPLSWFIHRAPLWFHKASCFGVFSVEVFVPLFFFAPRRWRLAACAVSIAFQLLIILTGNYCFFNLLTILLCLLLVDDDAWRKAGKFLFKEKADATRTAVQPDTKKLRWPVWVLAPFAGFVFLTSFIWMAALFRVPSEWLRPAVGLINAAAPFRSINSYGLFASMTTSRPEIIVEGSSDGVAWLSYEFRYKPGDLKKGPSFVAPYQPRLDWQMWFAALSGYSDNPWFVQFCVRLLEGSKPVLALLKTNPFPDKPPKYVRAWVYDYRFTSFSGRRMEGNWWERSNKRVYCPALSLRSRNPTD